MNKPSNEEWETTASLTDYEEDIFKQFPEKEDEDLGKNFLREQKDEMRHYRIQAFYNDQRISTAESPLPSITPSVAQVAPPRYQYQSDILITLHLSWRMRKRKKWLLIIIHRLNNLLLADYGGPYKIKLEFRVDLSNNTSPPGFPMPETKSKFLKVKQCLKERYKIEIPIEPLKLSRAVLLVNLVGLMKGNKYRYHIGSGSFDLGNSLSSLEGNEECDLMIVQQSNEKAAGVTTFEIPSRIRF